MTEFQIQLYTVLGALVGVLVVATIIGQLIRLKAVSGLNPTVENLNARILSWWVIVGVIGASMLSGGNWAILAFAFCSFVALREFLTHTDLTPSDHPVCMIAFFLILPIQYLLIWVGWIDLFQLFVPLVALAVVPAVMALRSDLPGFLARASEMSWGLLIAVYGVSHVPAFRLLEVPGYEGKSVLLILFLILCAQANDVFQYIFGKLWGKTCIAPQLSPGKTVEGFLGGIVCTALLGAALWKITPFSPGVAAIMALIIALMGFLGGLVLSAVKRDRHIKDWGASIKGHGGFLDRLDSVVISAPVFFHIVKAMWA